MELVATSDLELRALGRQIGIHLAGGMVIILRGELGAGKTTLVQGMAEGLGITQHVTSPSFSLIHSYRGSLWTLVHCDFYRLRSPEEAVEIGFLEYLTPENVVLVEWGEAFRYLMPSGAATITIEYDPRGRKIQAEGLVPVCLS
ncbi:MAG: tRNA (adenosine(37)-N6)-threonylcarbamoyltransferase complex ATPase subunit type 1 TsaE [Peptococcaceae bacterium]|nr:tRNA (adenosine(37)-N6)-threonylcarbamoyltransferase complex ATPase subunit type 1 TsaE [Peptococcaceae bacterium]